MKNLLRLLLKSQHQRNRSELAQSEKGMTLVELLVGAIMAFLIITPMLGFVVDMLNTDRREQVKSNTEQDVQAAVDFIAQDLSQAIYIYDNSTTVGVPKLLKDSFIPSVAVTNGDPILVFWKRQQLKNSLPIVAGEKPSSCADNTPLAGAGGACNDTYVLSLVAYYQVRGGPGIWCQPSGAPCPTRIVRYQIQDGLRDPTRSTDPNPANRYFADTELKNDTQKRSDAFNIGTPIAAGFDISRPTENVTRPNVAWDRIDVLVNYIDHGTAPAFTGTECTTALGNPTTQTGTTTSPIPEGTLKVTDTTTNYNGFYACVDTQRNLARVTIRGNSLRRIQTDADYAPNKSAYFPTASVQVEGLGGRGN